MEPLRALIVDLRNDMNRQFSQVHADVSELRGDMNRRIEALDGKHDRHFTWLVGLQMAIMVAVVGALVGAY